MYFDEFDFNVNLLPEFNSSAKMTVLVDVTSSFDKYDKEVTIQKLSIYTDESRTQDVYDLIKFLNCEMIEEIETEANILAYRRANEAKREML